MGSIKPILTVFSVCAVIVKAQVLPNQNLNPSRPLVCGTRFTDPASSAILSDVIVQGEVISLRQVSPIAPLLRRANIKIQKVYKGKSIRNISNKKHSEKAGHFMSFTLNVNWERKEVFYLLP